MGVREEFWKKAGGAAFPREHGEPGMTLRDWFAGQSLPALTAQYPANPERAAELAFKAADAMLARRLEAE